jgi:hypothetical protein
LENKEETFQSLTRHAYIEVKDQQPY